MKELLKNNLKTIIIVLITALVTSFTSIFAYSLVAGDVGFTPHDTTWHVENVEAALNNLNLRENQLDTHYSTEEQVVGEWIDGKPIYQRSFENVTFYGEQSTIVYTFSNDEQIDSIIYSWYQRQTYQGVRTGNAVSSIPVNVYSTNGTTNLSAYMTGASGVSVGVLTVQYTKSAD